MKRWINLFFSQLIWEFAIIIIDKPRTVLRSKSILFQKKETHRNLCGTEQSFLTELGELIHF